MSESTAMRVERGLITHSHKRQQKLVLDGFVYNKNSRWTSHKVTRDVVLEL